MQKLFDELQSLDERCYISYKLSEDILMEHAANGINVFIRWKFDKNSKIIIACGSGNNGADGLALARLLHKDYDVEIFYVNEQKSPMAILQIDRAHAIGVHSTFELNKCDVLVDALYGTGFKGNFNYEAKAVMQTINKLDAYKIACDIPSGLRQDGTCDKDTFRADITLTMGALKKSMFSEQAKERVGRIEVLDLGVPRSVYEAHTNWNLLDMDDLRLPHRVSKNSHKGTFGHLVIPCGEKPGAAIISGLSALKFGSGLVSLLSDTPTPHIPYSLMHTTLLPHNTSAIACGMGIGDTYTDEELLSFFDNTLPVIADADLLHKPVILELLQKEDLIVTPHPKEFISLLKLTQIADINVETLQNDRFKYCEEFSKKYPKVTLLLKGANVVIAKGDEYFINVYGTSALAKGGSGDVLSGLIGGLLAQGYNTLDAAINASLSHTKLVQNYQGADFSLTPEDLINGIGKL
ncbi:MAG: NAD(P)H-hydrate dehydratase [Helicobacteraceae bacterium]|nr:NAD(P)H-hydrate dehydratase [Candidatus Sulfurimonas ponti]